jgi:3-carboxy-cis,cis-muconate cycloisomerase
LPLIDCLVTTDALAAVFSDESVLQAMLDFEVALAEAAAETGAIPGEAAAHIRQSARSETFDASEIAHAAHASATPAIPLVKALTERVRAVDQRSADSVHWSATSQDVTDSALVLLLARARQHVAADHARLTSKLRSLSDEHASTVMLARTLLQAAAPTTFGLKAAGWHAAAETSWQRVAAAWDDVTVVQYGGAAGTRAAAGPDAARVAARIAEKLGLRPSAPWHSNRDRLGAFVAACGLYVAALGKIARDVALLMQTEIAEVAERGGGSSAMPHKRNPSQSVLVLAAAARMPGVVSQSLTSMIHEHERSAGGGQAEWSIVADAVQTTGSAAAAAACLLDGLSIDAGRMRANLDATQGVIFAERASILLTRRLGRERAAQLVSDAVMRAQQHNQSFGDAIRSMPEAAAALDAKVLADFDRPETWLGDAEAIRRELLS